MNEIIQPHPNALTQNPKHSSAPLTPTLSLAQVQQAMADRLAAYQASKLELADSMRDCCWDLPMETTLTIANHVAKWVKACCTVCCQEQPMEHWDRHTQAVLLIDGKMLVEPLVDEPKNFNEGMTVFVGRFHQASGEPWRLAKAMTVYDRAWAIWEEKIRLYGETEEAGPVYPPPFVTCDVPVMQEVAQALPEAMAAWHMQRHAFLGAQTIKNNALATGLKQ